MKKTLQKDSAKSSGGGFGRKEIIAVVRADFILTFKLLNEFFRVSVSKYCDDM